ncbi:hypothetical protein [Rhodococcus sp. Q1]|uniref:hypothetical protein n=1 Tax=unclassified Rhodococcus (in: high G+C Gram-positive bacteria) TaxID=192944 RepID=UPI0013ED8051|nr:hypothetical protein [Rhodococcus sp. Q1]
MDAVAGTFPRARRARMSIAAGVFVGVFVHLLGHRRLLTRRRDEPQAQIGYRVVNS